jgi:drug/metabolite transporter (DMT)-like permease
MPPAFRLILWLILTTILACAGVLILGLDAHNQFYAPSPATWAFKLLAALCLAAAAIPLYPIARTLRSLGERR